MTRVPSSLTACRWLVLASCVVFSSTGRQDLRLNYILAEEQSAGTFVGNVRTDARLATILPVDIIDDLTYRFLRRDVTMFDIDELSGVITVAGRIDRETVCSEGGGGSSSAVMTADSDCMERIDVVVQPMQYFTIVRVYINITDINDNAPRFPGDDVTLNVSESVAVGTRLPLPVASDADTGTFAVTGYRLESADDKFDLEVLSGQLGQTVQLVVTRDLDYEAQNSYTLTVYAYDGDGRSASNSGSVVVTVSVVDANDNVPVFEGEGRYEVTIPENLPVRTTILRVHATDADDGLNGQVVYSLGPRATVDHSRTFAVDPSTGDLYVVGDVDYERCSVYHFTLTATDGGPLPADGRDGSALASVTVYVTDDNDNSPMITVDALSPVAGRATTPEAAAVNSFVVDVVVTDADAGANGRVSCVLDDRRGDSRLFRLELAPSLTESAKEYRLLTAAVLDRETAAEYQLAVVCRDAAPQSRTSTSTLVVDVADVNDNSPVFSQSTYNAELIENNYIGAAVLQVSHPMQCHPHPNPCMSVCLLHPVADVFTTAVPSTNMSHDVNVLCQFVLWLVDTQ